MKHLRTISALILALVMVLTMGTSVFAAELGASGTIEATDNTVVVKKAISVINYAGYNYEPTITYTYTLSDGTGGGTVNDGTNTITLKAGSVGYLNGSAAQSAEFNKANAVSGDIASKDLSWTFDPSKFPSAGVYRFVLTESTSVEPASIGIDRPADYVTSKFLDVYVQNKDSGKEIYGFVLVDDEGAVTSDSSKSQGWNADKDLEKYETYNITITNNTTGALADTTAKFPYTVTLTGEMSAANISAEIGEGGKVTSELGNGESMTISGLPKTVKFAVAENNPTPDTYTTTATVEGVEGTTNADKASFKGDLDVVTGGEISNATAAISISVDNHLDSISPTNVVMRFAPYLFILGGAVVLLAVSRRRKAEQE